MRLVVILFGLIISTASKAQETVKGFVYDKTGAMAGVIVTEAGTENKVITDAKGEFEITTQTNQPTLTFMFVGFAPRTIKVKSDKPLKVKMKWDKLKYKHISRSNASKQRLL